MQLQPLPPLLLAILAARKLETRLDTALTRIVYELCGYFISTNIDCGYCVPAAPRRLSDGIPLHRVVPVRIHTTPCWHYNGVSVRR
jgi:hypothetical protein